MAGLAVMSPKRLVVYEATSAETAGTAEPGGLGGLQLPPPPPLHFKQKIKISSKTSVILRLIHVYFFDNPLPVLDCLSCLRGIRRHSISSAFTVVRQPRVAIKPPRLEGPIPVVAGIDSTAA